MTLLWKPVSWEHKGGFLGQKLGAESASVSFVLRAERPLPPASIVAGARAVRDVLRCAPELDVQHRVVTFAETFGRPGLSRRAAEAAARCASESAGVDTWVAIVPSDWAPPAEVAVQAERWIEIASRLVSPRVVERADALFMCRLFDEREWARDLARLLEPVADYDLENKTHVLRTLEIALLDVPGHMRVAEVLGIERHTVARHLNTAAALLGRDIRWGLDRMLVEQALLARRAISVRRRRSSPGAVSL